MNGTVSAKSQYGFKVQGNENWINYGNFYKGTQEFSVGDTINYETNGKFVKTLMVTGSDGAAPAAAQPKSNGYRRDPDVQAQINRSTAAKVAFGAYFPTLLSRMDVSEAYVEAESFAEKIVGYIANGAQKETTNGQQ